jgi:TorA-specific chaperone
MLPKPIDPVALADCFAELAHLFGEPLEQVEIAALLDNGRFDALHALADDPRHAIDLRAAFSTLRAPEGSVAVTSRLNATFCRLFLGIGGNSATLPIESAHRGGGRLFQDPTSAMTEMLAAHDLRPAEGFVEPPDHLAIELSLLEQLIRLEASVVDADEYATIITLRRRLSEWTPGFAAALAAHDSTGFYAALARVLVRLLQDAVPDRASAA